MITHVQSFVVLSHTREAPRGPGSRIWNAPIIGTWPIIFLTIYIQFGYFQSDIYCVVFALTQSHVFWDITLCGLLNSYRSLEGTKSFETSVTVYQCPILLESSTKPL